MISSFAALYPTAKVTYIQSSWLELATDVELHRVDIIGKAASRLKRGTGGAVAFHTTHSLLPLYNGPLGSIYLHTRRNSTHDLFAAIDQRIEQLPGGWRDHMLRFTWSDGREQVKRIIKRGSGNLLSYVPEFLARDVLAICDQFNAGTFAQFDLRLPLPSQSTKGPFGVLFIGNNYVIAQDFYVSTWWSVHDNAGLKRFPCARVG